MMDELWKGIALGCFRLAFSVLMGCVVRVGDWDILGVGAKFRGRGDGRDPEKAHGYIFPIAYAFNKAVANGLLPF